MIRIILITIIGLLLAGCPKGKSEPTCQDLSEHFMKLCKQSDECSAEISAPGFDQAVFKQKFEETCMEWLKSGELSVEEIKCYLEIDNIEELLTTEKCNNINK